MPKIYEALVDGRVSAETVRTLRTGVDLEDGTTLPARIDIMEREHPGGTWLRIELTEGRNRIVKRMCLAVGHRVRRLRRIRFAGIDAAGPAGRRVAMDYRRRTAPLRNQGYVEAPASGRHRRRPRAGPRPARRTI